MADDAKPSAEKSIGEQASDILGSIVGGVILLAIVAVLISVAVDETRWTFTTVTPSRVCANEQRSNCLFRTPGRVKLVDGSWFSVTVDQAPYVRDATLSHGPAPAVGSVVVLEDWNGRLVSVFDPARGRRRTGQWPNPSKDLLEAAAALVAPLAVAALFFFNLAKAIRRQRSNDGIAVTERHAQMS
jgi:hypothetical protein